MAHLQTGSYNRVQATTGADLNTPPPGPMSEILSDFQA
jgi:hypothetical protein